MNVGGPDRFPYRKLVECITRKRAAPGAQQKHRESATARLNCLIRRGESYDIQAFTRYNIEIPLTMRGVSSRRTHLVSVPSIDHVIKKISSCQTNYALFEQLLLLILTYEDDRLSAIIT